jgi:hypothetical protein
MAEEPSGWEIAIAVNAMVKGMLGAMGQSGHVCRRTIPLAVPLNLACGFLSLTNQVTDAVNGEILDGDIVVVADKVVGVAQGRTGPAEILSTPDPKTVDAATRARLAHTWEAVCGFPITPLHMLLADEYQDPRSGARAVLGCADHNAAAADLAAAIHRRTGRRVDVIISDTDTGLDVRAPLIGTVTFGATPLGATAGLTLYECMRCACAAEFERGHDKGVPIVVCRPAERCAKRDRIGEHRGYGGVLNADREGGLTYC